jgi:hypothetical protein
MVSFVRRSSAPLVRLLPALFVALGFGSSAARAAAPVDPNAKPVAGVAAEYLKQVKPLLAARCYACHGALKQEAGLRLDTAAAIRTGGDSGPAVKPGDAASILIARLTTTGLDERMPPEGEGAPFKPEEIALIRNWIAGGALGPSDEKPEADPREHWSFTPPVRPALPQVKLTKSTNPIDIFLAADHERRGIAPQPPAAPGVLLRRVYMDLTGLPPTWEEQQAFLADKSPEAYEKVVDRLLASPQHGERWGRHWMDVWRYSDWWGLGDQVRNSQKHIRHWRDWIIESLNDDVAYDEMVRQMLAADELYPEDMQRLRATGFLVRNYFLFNRSTWLEQTVEHTSKGFLGLTLNCAKCHDHKYDPLPQKDFYRFRAFFEPYQVRIDELPGEANLEKDGLPRVFDMNLTQPTFRFIRGEESKPAKDEPIAPAFPAITGVAAAPIVPVKLAPLAHKPSLRPWVGENHIRGAEAKVVEAKKVAAESPVKQAALVVAEAELAVVRAVVAAEAAKSQAKNGVPLEGMARELAEDAAEAERRLTFATARAALATADAEVAKARTDVAAEAKKETKDAAMKEAAKKAGEKKIADAEKKQKTAADALAVLRKAPITIGTTYKPISGSLKAFESATESDAERRTKPYPETSSGRRTALAQMITDRKNPLTARVAVNHIWLRHMGKPLVPTVFDFGRKGTPPTHPELLDWLAVELMDGPQQASKIGASARGWSMKHLHRLIVTSETYKRNSSTADNPSAAARDGDNVSYWHMNPIRLEAQAVRDALLHLSGKLDLTRGGPSIDPKSAEFSLRRSLYFVHSHNDHHRFLATFDDADVLDCYRRDQSIVPQQALALANAQQSLTASGLIAARLVNMPHVKTDDDYIRAAFRLILAVEPSADEQSACRDALAEWRKLPAAPGTDASLRARVNLAHALLNHNDFVTLR